MANNCFPCVLSEPMCARTGLCSALAQRQCSVPYCGLPRLTEGTGERLRKSLVEDSR